MLTGKVHRLRKCLKQSLYDMMRFIAVKQLQMQIAAAFIGKSLKELPGEAKAELARGILVFGCFSKGLIGFIIQSPPNEKGTAAEIDHAASEAFIHGHISLTG